MNERVFVDTNLFLRYITNDIPAQADSVELLLERAGAGEVALVTNSLVISEIVWTLESFYRLPRPAVREQVLAILNTPGLDVVDSDLVLQAINWHVEKNISYGDAYNAAWLTALGIHSVYTFDRKHFARIEGITIKIPPDRGQ
jgi:uncharacterized protein